MSSSGTVSIWIQQLKAGEEAALARLHARYASRLIALARRKLTHAGAPRRAADEEDVAQEAFVRFYRRLRDGKPLRLENRQDFLALMTHIVACEACNQIHHSLDVQKRRASRTQSDSVLEGLADAEPGPLEQAILSSNYQHYLDGLPEHLRPCAELHLVGYTQEEIAERLGCVERTVQRKLALILERWQEMAAASLDG